MKKLIYSHSRLSTFEQCPLKFKFRYIDEIIPEVEMSIEAHLGSVVHKALEWLYLKVQDKKVPSIDDIISYFTSKWEESYSPKITLVKNDLTAADYFNRGVVFLLNYYKKHYPFDEGTLEIEKKVGIDLNGDGKYVLQGFIDRFAYNSKENRYEIHDYKTGSFLPTQEKINSDRQLALYSLALKETLGKEIPIFLVWHYLAHDTKIILEKTSEELEKLKKEVIELIDKIENTNEFPPQPSNLCNWCEYKNICPAKV